MPSAVTPLTTGCWSEARTIFEQVALADDFVDFLTLPAYDVVVARQ